MTRTLASLLLLCVLVSGCASIDSDRRSERFAALESVKSVDALIDIVYLAKHDDVREAAVERIESDAIHLSLIKDCRLPTGIRCASAIKIRNETNCVAAIYEKSLPEDCRLRVLDRVNTDAILLKIALDESIGAIIQNKSAGKVRSEESCLQVVRSNATSEDARFAAAKRLDTEHACMEVVDDFAIPIKIREVVARKIKTPELCSRVIGYDFSPVVREKLSCYITNETVIVGLLVDGNLSTESRLEALLKVKSNGALCNVAMEDGIPLKIRFRAIEKLSEDPLEIKRLVLNLTNSICRIYAAEKLGQSLLDETDVADAIWNMVYGSSSFNCEARRRVCAILANSISNDLAKSFVLTNNCFSVEDKKLIIGSFNDEQSIMEVVIGLDQMDVDHVIRDSCLKKITDNRSCMMEIFMRSKSKNVKYVALSRLRNEDFKTHLLQQRLLEYFRVADQQHLPSVLKRIPWEVEIDSYEDSVALVKALTAEDSPEIRRLVGHFLVNQDVLDEMVQGGFGVSKDVSLWGVSLMPNDVCLLRIIRTATDEEIRCRAAIRMSSNEILSGFATDVSEKKSLRIVAIRAMTEDSECLRRLSEDKDIDIAVESMTQLCNMTPENSGIYQKLLQDRLNALTEEERSQEREFEVIEERLRKEAEQRFEREKGNVVKGLDLKFKEIDEMDLLMRFKNDVGGRFTFKGVVIGWENNWLSDDEIYIDVASWGKTIRLTCIIDTLPANLKQGQPIKVTGTKVGDDTLKISSIY